MCDLRIEHGAFSRQQFIVERGLGSAGEPRFRLTPLSTTNPTLVNDHPAVEGQLLPGDTVAVGDVRLRLEGPERVKAARVEASPFRLVLLTFGFVLVGLVGWLYFGPSDDQNAHGLDTPTPLFLPHKQTAATDRLCGNPIECGTRARESYTRGKKLMAQASADPGNYYRATLELERAQAFVDEAANSGAARSPDLDDLPAQHELAQKAAEQTFADAKFRLTRAVAAGDNTRAASEADLLSRIVPDPTHPYRIRLDAYRRTLGAQTQKAGEP